MGIRRCSGCPRVRTLDTGRTRNEETPGQIQVGTILLAKVVVREFDYRDFRRWLVQALNRDDDRALRGKEAHDALGNLIPDGANLISGLRSAGVAHGET